MLDCHRDMTRVWFSSTYWRVVCICRLAHPEWVKGAVEPIIAMGFVRSKCSVAVLGVMGF